MGKLSKVLEIKDDQSSLEVVGTITSENDKWIETVISFKDAASEKRRWRQ